MNRVGDVGLLLAMMTMVGQVGSVSFDAVSAASLDGSVSTGWLTAIGFFLLLAACGKSAQFPLQAWLGDAMAGPTPVSALIHAATMVTAGVYLMVRSAAVFEGAPTPHTASPNIYCLDRLAMIRARCKRSDIPFERLPTGADLLIADPARNSSATSSRKSWCLALNRSIACPTVIQENKNGLSGR